MLPIESTPNLSWPYPVDLSQVHALADSGRGAALGSSISDWPYTCCITREKSFGMHGMKPLSILQREQ